MKKFLPNALWMSIFALGTALFHWSCVTTAFEEVIANYSHPQHGWHRADGKTMKNPVSADGRSLTNGAKLYKSYCQQCHGASKTGDGPAAKDLKRQPANLVEAAAKRTDHHLYLQISLGRDGMPMWRGALSDQDRWDIVNFLKK